MPSKYGRFPQDLNAPSSTVPSKYLYKSVFGVMKPQRANQMMDWLSTVIYWSVKVTKVHKKVCGRVKRSKRAHAEYD